MAESEVEVGLGLVNPREARVGVGLLGALEFSGTRVVVFLASKSFNPINFISLFGLFQAEDVTVFRERRRARGMIAREQ